MTSIVEANLPIERQNMPLNVAVRKFEAEGNVEKVCLLRQIERDTVSLYTCDGITDYFYGPMVPETLYLKQFELQYYSPGFILMFPDKTNPDSIPAFRDNPKLAQIFLEAERWGEILGCPTVSQLNQELLSGGFLDIMRVAEALHEKKVAAIADLVDHQRQSVKLVLIAGPSSSGKTTFAQRLGIQLRVHGIRPVSISLDDYFLDRENSPRTANGDYDFESINALDLPLFNQHLVSLLAGEVVEPPTYNFKVGRREYTGKKLQVGPNHVLVIEGIHGLNPQLTNAVPRHQKMLIYVSALTQLAIDRHNRIPTTDTRLIRRIVRDNQFRSHGALQTLRMWPSVRSGEEMNIFPFQEQADVMFNSALIYEVAVLRRYAEPLLAKITPEYPEYLEARRLTGFLRHFRPAPDFQVPLTSILREFIGEPEFA
jgi:uridine kinase